MKPFICKLTLNEAGFKAGDEVRVVGFVLLPGAFNKFTRSAYCIMPNNSVETVSIKSLEFVRFSDE